jgi:raffinose/stachyose/melibiose transport system permease protein
VILVRALRRWWLEIVALLVAAVVFLVPFAFTFVTAAKDEAEASALDFSWPTNWRLLKNIRDVVLDRDGLIVTAFKNSFVLTVGSVTLLVVLAAMVAFVLQRRNDRVAKVVDVLLLAGLILPPAVVPTVFVLQELHLFKTLIGLILVEVAFILPFAVLVFRALVASIPRELDDAAIIDGASPLTLFFRIILPMLRPAVITVIVVSSVAIYNDFVNPLYFLPGDDNATVQLTLFNFQSQYRTQWNLLFMDVLLVTIPPLIMFVFFNRKIVSGMTAGAVKG